MPCILKDVLRTRSYSSKLDRNCSSLAQQGGDLSDLIPRNDVTVSTLKKHKYWRLRLLRCPDSRLAVMMDSGTECHPLMIVGMMGRDHPLFL